MDKERYVVDDRCIIPDDIKNMTKEELDEAIKKMEQELQERKKVS